jgi:hypothetical protein
MALERMNGILLDPAMAPGPDGKQDAGKAKALVDATAEVRRASINLARKPLAGVSSDSGQSPSSGASSDDGSQDNKAHNTNGAKKMKFNDNVETRDKTASDSDSDSDDSDDDSDDVQGGPNPKGQGAKSGMSAQDEVYMRIKDARLRKKSAQRSSFAPIKGTLNKLMKTGRGTVKGQAVGKDGQPVAENTDV